MNFDSPAVLALKEKLVAIAVDDSDWARTRRKRLHKLIRDQRLAEARERGTHKPEEWEAILVRFEFRCVRCGYRPWPRPCKDHIQPIHLGGSDAAANLQPLCRECNSSKGPDTFNWAAYREQHGFEEGEADV